MDSVQIARQNIFGAAWLGAPVATEILARDPAFQGNKEWDIALLSNVDRIYTGTPLHINVYPATFGRLNTMEAQMPISGMKDKVVFEILEGGINGHLPDILTFAAKGYRLALDDFGALESNYDLLCHLPPKLLPIIKIDMNLLHHFTASHVMSLCCELRRCGYLVYLEGVENLEHLLADVDGYQGYLFHHPATEILLLKIPSSQEVAHA